MKDYYKELKINKFRGIKNLEIRGLTDINLFFGDNNTGKTSILEAVFAHSCGNNINALINNLLLKRQMGYFNSIYDFGENFINFFNKENNSFYNMDFSIETVNENNEKNNINYKFIPSDVLEPLNDDYTNMNANKIDYNINQELEKNKNQNQNVYLGNLEVKINNKKNVFKIHFPLNIPIDKPFKSCVYHDILDHRIPERTINIYAVLKRSNKMKEFIEKIQKIYPEVQDIEGIPLPSGVMKIYISLKNKRIPLSDFGDGFRRWYHIIGSMVLNPKSIHLIEEVDATFHPKSIPNFAETLFNYSKNYYNQIFMTSHSQEFLHIFLKTFKNKEFLEKNISIFTLKEINDELKILKLTGIEALKNIEKYNMELR
jgi:AAA15 family ATPase/GTPase